MIKKILEIKDFAVFCDFEWDKHVVDSQGKDICLQDVNIFFGRNYAISSSKCNRKRTKASTLWG